MLNPPFQWNGHIFSSGSVRAIEAVLQKAQLKYATVNSRQVNRMNVQQLMAHRLLIVPGGNYITIGDYLSDGAATNVHAAVQGGLNYLGICAGGLLAGNPPSRGINLTSGVRFDFYKVVNQGVHKTPVTITGVRSIPIEHYWEDSPQFAGWGQVVANILITVRPSHRLLQAKAGSSYAECILRRRKVGGEACSLKHRRATPIPMLSS